MKQIKFVDTTVRDGSLSLWALGMRTGAMLAIAEQMDQCGFESMEFFRLCRLHQVRQRAQRKSMGVDRRGAQEVSRHAAALSRWISVGI